MKAFAALPLLALAGCSVCQPTRFTWPVFDDPLAALITASDSSTQPSFCWAQKPSRAVISRSLPSWMPVGGNSGAR